MSMYYLNPATGKYELQGAPHVDAYSKAQTDALIAENAGVQMEVLWENASPTSAFSAQTIALNLTDYDNLVMVVQNSGGYGLSMMLEKNLTMLFFSFGNVLNAGNTDFYRRDIKATNGGIEVSACNMKSGSTTSINNNTLVPTYLYGIKGAKA